MSAPDLRFAADAETFPIDASEAPASSVVTDKESRRTVLSARSCGALLTLCEGLAAFSAAALGMFTAYYACVSMHLGMQPQFPIHEATAASVISSIFIVLLLRADRGHSALGSPLQINETERALRASARALLILLPLNYFVHLGLSTSIVFIGAIFTAFLLIVEARLLVAVLCLLQAEAIGVERVVVYADAETGSRIASLLLHSPRLRFLPVVVVDAGSPQARECCAEAAFPPFAGFPVHHGPLTAVRLQSWRCNLLVVDAVHSVEEIAHIQRTANEAGCRLALLPALSVARGQSMTWLHALDPLAAVGPGEAVSWFYPVAKRIADVVLSFVLLVALAPLLALIALLVCFDSPGPALFIQRRVGQNGVIFKIYKFRSMHMGVPRYEISPVSSRDRRITRVGRWLRRTSLDELPQLFNVLTGSMSLVGPRPEMPFLVEQHAAQHALRLQAKPGLTGLWQLSPARAAQIHENPEYDHYYIRNRSCGLDVAILIHTLLSAVRGI